MCGDDALLGFLFTVYAEAVREYSYFRLRMVVTALQKVQKLSQVFAKPRPSWLVTIWGDICRVGDIHNNLPFTNL